MSKSKTARNQKSKSARKKQAKAQPYAKHASSVPARPETKQATVIELLSRAEGTTIEAIMKATGWQRHSVHGFFAGVVRKNLQMTLKSEKVDGGRVYRIAAGSGGSRRQSKRLAA